jgi:carboxyl-terminal processing protease
MNYWKKAGLITLGAVLGVLLSINFSVIAQRDAKLPIPYEDLQLLSAVFGRIKSDYVEPVSDEKLIKEAINGMVHGLDPHSDFLDAEAFKDLQISTQGKFGGLGIEVGVEDGAIRVISPIEETPAFRAGIKAGDLIVKIDETATRGMPLTKAVEMMRGKPGTSVGLTIARKDAEGLLSFTLVREEINVKSVRAKMTEPATATSAFASSRTAPARISRRRSRTCTSRASSRGSCSICAAIQVACSTRRLRYRRPSCPRTRWSYTPTAARPKRGCA